MEKVTEGMGGNVKRSVPPKRYAKPAVTVVKMADVPQPTLGNGSIAQDLYVKIGDLKLGMALRAEFESEKHGYYVRGRLRKLAKKDKQFMSSSRSADGLVWYFWLEKL